MRHFTFGKKAKTKIGVCNIKDAKGRPKKWLFRVSVKYVHDRKPIKLLSKKVRSLIIEMLGILAEKLRIVYLLDQEREKTALARAKKAKWQEVYDIQKELQKHRRRLKHYRHYTNRELYSYAPHRLAKIFGVNRSVIYRILSKYVLTGDVLFLGDNINKPAEEADSIETAKVADSRTAPLSKEQKSGSSSQEESKILDPASSAGLSITSENDYDPESMIWSFVTINRSKHQTIRETSPYWYKRSNRDLLTEHQEYSTIDYFRVTTDYSDIPGEAYVYKHSKSNRTGFSRLGSKAKDIEI